MKKYKEEERLRQKYAELTEERIQNADSAELLHALALRIQRELEKESDMNAAFLKLSAEQQAVYALNYLLCEDTDSLSGFFRAYGQPLTGAALRGAEQTFPQDAMEVFRLACKMFDDTDETTSCTKESVQSADERFAKINKQEILNGIKAYIIQNIRAF